MLRITPNPFGILQKTILAAAVILSMTLGVAFGDGVEKYLGAYQGSLLMAVGGYETPASVWGPTEPEYVDTQKKPASESPAKMGVNQYYIFPYGLTHIVMQFHTLRQAQEYTGKSLDEGSGFYYFHARHYDALGGGRFIGEDLVPPDLSNPLTLNPFLYCLNNPGRWVDLDGRVPLLVPLAVAAVAIVMNPTPTDTEGGHAQATKGMVKDIVLSVVGDKAIGAGKVARWWGGRAGTVAEAGVAKALPAPKASSAFWPPNRGFNGEPALATFRPGARIDRYGSPLGTFVSPAGTPFNMRSLPQSSSLKPLQTYEILKPFEAKAGPASPWFGQPGGGLQFELDNSVQYFLDFGYLKEVKP